MEFIGQTRIGYLYLPDGKIIKFAVNGLSRSGLDYGDPYVDQYMFKQYEEVESRIRYLKTKPGDIMLDVGACIGTWSVHAAVYGAKVYAFEIGKPHIQTLMLNSRLNNVKNMILIHKIALRSNNDVELVYDGWMHVCRKSDALDDGSLIQIKSIALDQWVKQYNLPHINYIKIDVEGMELNVLKGAINTLKEFKPKLIVEIHDETPDRRSGVENLLKDLGYNHEHIPGLNDYFYPNSCP